MKNTLKTWLLIMAVLGQTLSGRAFSPATAGPSFLRIGVGARPSGMGEAFTAGSDDASSVPWNPAGLGLVGYTQFTAMHMSFLADTSYEALSIAQPVGLGTVAGSFMYLGVPPFDSTQGLDVAVSSGDYAAAASYGTKLGYLYPFGSALDDMLLGASLKWVGLQISGVSAFNYLAADLGVSYKSPWKGFNVGLSLLNMGAAISQVSISDALPFEARAGLAYEWESGIALMDLVQYLDNTTYFNLGTELWWQHAIALRAGYKFGGPQVGGVSGLTAGAGWQFGSIRVDYAYVPYGDLGTTHRVSGTFAFGALEVGSGKLGGPEDLFNQGMVYYDDGFLEEAVTAWEKAKSLQPGYPKLADWLHTAQEELRDEKKSDEFYGHVQAGDGLYKLGKYKDAIAEWTQASRIAPTIKAIYKRIAKAERNLGMNPQSPEEHSKRAQDALAREDYTQAIAEWEAAQAENPASASQAQGAIASIKQQRASRVSGLFNQASDALRRNDTHTAIQAWRQVQPKSSSGPQDGVRSQDRSWPGLIRSADLAELRVRVAERRFVLRHVRARLDQ